jgi:hypothetical protein
MKLKEWFKKRKRADHVVYPGSRSNDKSIDLERIEALYGDFHHECGDRD